MYCLVERARASPLTGSFSELIRLGYQSVSQGWLFGCLWRFSGWGMIEFDLRNIDRSVYTYREATTSLREGLLKKGSNKLRGKKVCTGFFVIYPCGGPEQVLKLLI